LELLKVTLGLDERRETDLEVYRKAGIEGPLHVQRRGLLLDGKLLFCT
jgi:hypothetical protein